MSKLNIACLLSPMADTEGPMDIVDGTVLTGPKKIMGKYSEVGLEAAITFAEENPDLIHTDILTIGKSKEVTQLQQAAIAMIQPKKHPGSLGVHALEQEDIDAKDAFEVADLLVAMIGTLEQAPDLIFTGRESMDYAHGVVGPAVAQRLGIPYYSGVNEVAVNLDGKSVTASFIEGNDKIVMEIALPAAFGTTDWLNGKDSARFTSLKGVMMAKKFKRSILTDLDTGQATSRTGINAISAVKSERRNQVLQGEEGPDLAKQAFDILANQDKALSLGGKAEDSSKSEGGPATWTDGDPASLNLADDVVVIADHDGHHIRLSTHQVLSQARMLADETGKKLTLVVPAADLSSMAPGCLGFGADRVVGLVSPQLEHQNLETVAGHLRALLTQAPSFLITVANDLGRDLAATMASAFNSGLLQDAVQVSLNCGAVSGQRIISNARFQSEEIIKDGGSCNVISLRPTAFDPAPNERETSLLTVNSPDLELKGKVTEVVAGEQTKGIPLNEAKIIVSGGRGMKGPENFSKLDELASLLGGTVGASRAVTDLEWVPHNLQIGQTGTTVAPDVYFAIGISGAIQHLTGMLGAKYIVAINSDGDAPIHKHADLSIVDKWENVLPGLIEAVRNGLA